MTSIWLIAGGSVFSILGLVHAVYTWTDMSHPRRLVPDSAGVMQVRVTDSGRGFTQSSGDGTGLANIRARLTAMYGSAGRLTLTRNTPRGVVATVAVPLAFAAVA